MPVDRLQWGHHFAVVDTSAGSERLSAYGRLQWGHHFAVVDTKHDLVAVSAFATASMGPPLCSGGYGEVTYFACPQVESLQWGHHFAVVDTASTSATTWNRSTCFNGATTLQWWIRAGIGSPLDVEMVGLQWGHHFAVVDT